MIFVALSLHARKSTDSTGVFQVLTANKELRYRRQAISKWTGAKLEKKKKKKKKNSVVFTAINYT